MGSKADQKTIWGTVCPTNAHGAYTRLATPKRPGGDPLRLALAIVLEPMAHNGPLLGARPQKADQGNAEEEIAHR